MELGVSSAFSKPDKLDTVPYGKCGIYVSVGVEKVPELGTFGIFSFFH